MTKLDFRGHNGLRCVDADVIPNEWVRNNVQESLDRHSDLFERYGSKLSQSVFDTLNLSMRCSACSQYLSGKRNEDGVYVMGDSDCAYPDGVPPYTFRIPVPSGRLLFMNDLRFVLGEDRKEPDVSINYEVGKKKLTQWYAENGIAHVFVGNSCPSVHTMRDGLYTVANFYTDDDDEHATAREDLVTTHGMIITDLWWFSAMDYDRALVLASETEDERFQNGSFTRDYFVVEVVPGVYEFTDYMLDFDTMGDSIFSSFKRVE